MCPTFVADCLETLEEIGMRAREQWLALGGEELVLVPSLNAEPRWVAYAAERVRGAARELERAPQDESDAAAARPDAIASDTPTPAT
jgi:ferrochelatase